MNPSVVIAAGGTGGHLVPALAIARAIARSCPEASIAFVGTSRAVERDILDGGYRSHQTSVRPFGRGARAVLGPLSMLPATFQARRVLRAERASVVVGMGGYPSLPVVAAARLTGVASVLHEQNAVPGLANAVAARLTPNIAVSFPHALDAFGARAPRLVGVPLREEIAGFDRSSLRLGAMKEFDLDPARRTVLVVGGSLGASRLNDAAVGLSQRWRARSDLQFVLATGRQHAGDIQERLARGDLLVRCLPYIERMDLAYAAADLVVSRAGASTVAELAVTATPSVLVPLPIARRKEQHANARAMADAGGAVTLDDRAVDAAGLGEVIEGLLDDRERLAGMSEGARSIARRNAAQEMAAWILELAS